jgi:quinol monooxygenase YgiN
MQKCVLTLLIFLACCGVYRIVTAAPEADESICVVTHVDAMPNFAAPCRALLREFAVETRKDPGATRVEVFEELLRPNHSTVVEIWKSRKAYDDHLALDHTRAYRTKLQPMLGSPFDERLHRENP